MSTKNYMAENQRILDEWQKAFEKNGGNADNFSWDGILLCCIPNNWLIFIFN